MNVRRPATGTVDPGFLGLLSRLGPVLCLYPARDTHLLAGLTQSVAVFPTIRIDSSGPFEALTFVDPEGGCCWQLLLVPDTDFYAWSSLLNHCGDGGPCRPPRHPPGHQAIDLAVGDPVWRACALRLHVLPGRAAGTSSRVAAGLASLSPVGREAASRLAGRANATLALTNEDPGDRSGAIAGHPADLVPHGLPHLPAGIVAIGPRCPGR